MRIENKTHSQIESATIKMGISENTYGKLKPGQISDYKNFEDYGYPDIKLKINGKEIEFNIHPFEAYEGSPSSEKSKPLTCVITDNPATNDFGVHFVE